MRYEGEFDQALANEQEILPSSGFAASVMDTVQREASAPPPIPFPWKRALPGIVACSLAVVFVVGVTIAALIAGRGGRPVAMPVQEISVLHAMQSLGAGWVVLALLISFLCVKVTSLALGKS